MKIGVDFDTMVVSRAGARQMARFNTQMAHTNHTATEFAAALRAGERHLARRDPFLRGVIKRNGPCTLKKHRRYYETLVTAIISQQLSSKAADTIIERFCALFAPAKFPEPAQILATPDKTLRSAGLSNAKAAFIKDLASHVETGALRLDRLSRLPDEEIIQRLTAVKGIGVWTAHMFLIFSMGRLDVLPVGDLGVRNAIQRHYGFQTAPSPADMEALAETNGWRPYRSIAAWYMWRALADESLRNK